ILAMFNLSLITSQVSPKSTFYNLIFFVFHSLNFFLLIPCCQCLPSLFLWGRGCQETGFTPYCM
ncbi:unnamed protein product, partial [Tetraodon nigroviridis]